MPFLKQRKFIYASTQLIKSMNANLDFVGIVISNNLPQGSQGKGKLMKMILPVITKTMLLCNNSLSNSFSQQSTWSKLQNETFLRHPNAANVMSNL